MSQTTNARILELKNKYELLNVAIPDAVIEKWQRIIDLLAEALGSNTGRINRFLPEYFETLVTSSNETNLEKIGNQYSLVNDELRWYCKQVFESKESLAISDSDNDEAILGYESTDKQLLNIRSYLGYPIELPDGNIFGTICVEDAVVKEYDKIHKEIIVKFKGIIEGDIQFLLDQFEQLMEYKESSELLTRVNHDLKTKLDLLHQNFSAVIQNNDTLNSIIKEQAKQLNKLNRAIKESAYVNSHKLRGPLARILGLIRILDIEPDMSKDVLYHLNIASQELDKVIHEIQEILSKTD